MSVTVGHSTTPCSIRRADAGDAAPLTDLMHASQAYRGRYVAMIEGYRITADQISRDQVFVAVVHGRIVGFYSLVLGERAELDLMFVADAWQGSGVGRQLFAHMVAQAFSHGAATVRIVSHPPAVAFYKRQGARSVGCQAASGRVSWEREVLSLPVVAPSPP